jgi:hypothetical protein
VNTAFMRFSKFSSFWTKHRFVSSSPNQLTVEVHLVVALTFFYPVPSGHAP